MVGAGRRCQSGSTASVGRLSDRTTRPCATSICAMMTRLCAVVMRGTEPWRSWTARKLDRVTNSNFDKWAGRSTIEASFGN